MAPVMREGLHITVQGVGFTDEVTDRDVERIRNAATVRLAQRTPFEIQIGPPTVDEETIGLPVTDPAALHVLRDDLQGAIADVWGSDHVPERGDRFQPHLTMAYSTGVASISDIDSTLIDAGLREIVVSDIVVSVSLIDLNRDNRQYEWREIAKVPLGT
ncbi:2'-5' RNA ligase family protein [Nocardia terpenica]|uniref:2'-5' RNA ligase family protein n=1 Tax=Nocardia terpenica TaxID=455432 RepID=UPI002FE0EF3E